MTYRNPLPRLECEYILKTRVREYTVNSMSKVMCVFWAIAIGGGLTLGGAKEVAEGNLVGMLMIPLGIYAFFFCLTAAREDVS